MQLAKIRFEFGIFQIKSRKVENGRKMSKPFSTFTFEIRNIWNAKAKTVKLDKKNTDSIGLNIENDAVRFGIFPFRFHSYSGGRYSTFLADRFFLSQTRRLKHAHCDFRVETKGHVCTVLPFYYTSVRSQNLGTYMSSFVCVEFTSVKSQNTNAALLWIWRGVLMYYCQCLWNF